MRAGHDGTWVAHPGLVPVAKDVFDRYMNGGNQLDRRREDLIVTSQDLTALPRGDITERGLRHNIDVGIQYLESWLRGSGCVPIYNLMEDAATAEISRSQVWQWVRHGACMSDGREITPEVAKNTMADELEKMRRDLGAERFDGGKFQLAARLFEEITTKAELTEFMTLVAYDHID